MDIMAHLSPQLQHRFLARLLSPEDTLAVIQHLRECDACREALTALRVNKPGALVDTVLDDTSFEHLPSADSLAAYLDNALAGPDRVDLDEHLRTCELCRDALADLTVFREELLHSPRREYAPGSWPSASRASESRSKWGSLRDRWRLIGRFNQPLVFAGVAAVAALILVLGVLMVRSPATFGIAGARSESHITIADGDHQFVFGPNGIANPTAPLPKDALATLNNLASLVWRDQSLALSPSVKDKLTDLKRAPSVLLGQPSVKIPFQVLSPIRTLVKSAHPTLKWTTAPGATSYTVHVIADDRTQEEVATSPTLPAPATDVTTREWTIPESTSLAFGKRYRWYVTAVSNDQEIDAPGIEEPQAKFAVLSEEELAQLSASKKEVRGDRFVEGSLNLKAGLLDDAQADFESLLADPAQTSAAKDFLNRVIAEIRRLKEA
jgi:anti-sigma factor RsiW